MVRHVGVREGYDQWAETYDATSNPLVALDRRVTLGLLAPRNDELILDAGCGTGANLRAIAGAGSRPVGVDFSWGMLRVARRNLPGVGLARADLERGLPAHSRCFDAVLCALVGEHLRHPSLVFGDAFDVLKPGGRLMFSVFHPELAAAGIEANFEREGTEYRLGALRHSVDDYLSLIDDCGFKEIQRWDFPGDHQLVTEVPWAEKYLGRPLLLAIAAQRPH
jgi:SAM-dependent methyltransferase